MLSQVSRDWGLPVPNDNPVYVELRERTERTLWRHGKQGLDSKYIRIGNYCLGMFTGDGVPNLVSVELAVPPTRGLVTVLNDNTGDFREDHAQVALIMLRARMVLDDLADI